MTASHLEHGISSWHVIVICMRVFVFTQPAPEQNPPPKPQGGGKLLPLVQ